MHQKFHSSKYKLLILAFFLLLIPNKVHAIVSPTSEFYVNDYANILSEETEKYIVDKSSKLNSVDGTQIVVVTVKNLEGSSLEDYALKLFRKFGIGDKKKNNGLLLLLALEERKFRVEVGYGLEGILPDAKTGRFQDEYIIPYLKNNEWDKGIKNGYDAFYTDIVKENNLDLEYNEATRLSENSDSDDIVMVLTLFVIGLGIALGLIAKKYKLVLLGYIILVALLFVIFKNNKGCAEYIYYLFVNVLAFLCSFFSVFSNIGSISGGGSGSSWSSGSSSGFSGFSGGGGSSGGAGSSRGF